VPERREERTTEGGLGVREKERDIAKVVEQLHEHNILISLFINPDVQQVKAASRTGVTHIELHTGYYANASGQAQDEEFGRLQDAAIAAYKLGLRVNAGHGLHYRNTARIAALEYIEELNIGHAIIARAVLVGMDLAVRDMLALM
jgi:pyridoxine 5-phosphate synthase